MVLATLTSPRSFLEMQNLRSYPRPTGSASAFDKTPRLLRSIALLDRTPKQARRLRFKPQSHQLRTGKVTFFRLGFHNYKPEEIFVTLFTYIATKEGYFGNQKNDGC